MICALLVFETPKLPRPLSELSPWLDWLAIPESDLFAELEQQQHRRFIKTHTPLDGLPLYDDVHYVVVARDPLDMAVSLYHQGGNLDRERIAELTGTELRPAPAQLDLVTWMTNWIRWSRHYAENLDSLPGVMWHLSDAWERRDAHNVVLVHYDDLLANLPGEMARLVDELGFAVDPDQVDSLAGEATFAAMKGRSHELIPDRRWSHQGRRPVLPPGSIWCRCHRPARHVAQRIRERTSKLAPAELLSGSTVGDCQRLSRVTVGPVPSGGGRR